MHVENSLKKKGLTKRRQIATEKMLETMARKESERLVDAHPDLTMLEPA